MSSDGGSAAESLADMLADAIGGISVSPAGFALVPLAAALWAGMYLLLIGR